MAMLSRFAENAFWMGRYVERAENLARVLGVTEAFAAGSGDENAWSPILETFADEEAFAKTKKPLNGLSIARFYLIDSSNLNSVLSAISMLKENARALRHLISTEAWRQITVFHGDVSAIAKRRFSLSKISDICADIRQGCFTHRGVIEATCYRDEVWRFNRLGAALERADQISRLIDMKYYQVDRGEDAEAVATPDVAWWNTLLRSASGYHAFQCKHAFAPTPADAAAFLLFDRQMPRSVRASVDAAFYHLGKLENDLNAKPGRAVKAAAKTLADRLDTPPARLTGRALNLYLDQVQLEIMGLANALYDRYFDPGA